jgi:hypothetical protein
MIRNRSGPDQVVQVGFEPGRIAVTDRYQVATADQHGAGSSGVQTKI